MHEHVYLNGSTVRNTEASTELVVTPALLYGKGAFTTVAIKDHKPFLWEKHWRRLVTNAEKLGIDLSDNTEEKTRTALQDLIDANRVEGGRARITFLDESPSPMWSSETEGKTSLLITTADFRPIPEDLKLTVSPYRVNTTSPLIGVKSCNYLEHLMAFDEAKKHGFDEAVRVNERGEIASACMANVFWTKDGKLYTPSLKTECLAGTTREYVLENLECNEVEAGIEEFEQADQIFLTSAGIGVISVAEFQSRKLHPPLHPILALLPGSI